MSGTTLYPLWKQAAETIRTDALEEPEVFYADDEIAAMVGEASGTQLFAFSMMAMRDSLLRHNLVLLRVRDAEGTGYKLASEKEKLTVEAERLFRRARNALIRELTTLHSIDVAQLESADRLKLDDRRRRCGLRVLATTPRLARELMKYVEMDNRTPRKWLEQLDPKEYKGA